MVSVESYRPHSGMKQCFRCQNFNLTFPGCNLTPSCLLYPEPHSHRDRPIKTQAVENKQLLKFAICGERGHPDSYRQCQSYVAVLENYIKPINSPSNNRNQTNMDKKSNSRKTTQELSFSSTLRGKQPLLVTQSQLILLKEHWKQLFLRSGLLVLKAPLMRSN